jgi:hypothetical protein
MYHFDQVFINFGISSPRWPVGFLLNCRDFQWPQKSSAIITCHWTLGWSDTLTSYCKKVNAYNEDKISLKLFGLKYSYVGWVNSHVYCRFKTPRWFGLRSTRTLHTGIRDSWSKVEERCRSKATNPLVHPLSPSGAALICYPVGRNRDSGGRSASLSGRNLVSKLCTWMLTFRSFRSV